ncbi:HEAT repeat domain-containing protein [Spirillospora sp. NBC_00431]
MFGRRTRRDAEDTVEQALALCHSGRRDDVVAGLQALQDMPAPLVPQHLWPRIRQVTGALCGPGQRDPEVLAAAIPVHVTALGTERDPVELLRTMLRHEDGRVRAAAAASAAWAHDPVALVSVLLSLLEEDPLPAVATAAATGLALIVSSDPSAAERFAALFAAHLDDPGRAVSAWRRAKAILLAAADPGTDPGPADPGDPGPAALDPGTTTLSDDLRDELQEPLTSLRGLDWTGQEVRALAIGLFIDAVNGSMRRYAPVPGWDEPARRTAVRDLLQRARTHPAGSEERDETLVQLLPDASAPAWSDRHAVNVAVDEALTLCDATDKTGTALGTETLAILTSLGTPGRSRRIRAALAALRAHHPDDPIVLAAMLRTYSGLAARGLLDQAADRPDAFVLNLLEHENAQVRATAAAAGNLAPAQIAERQVRLVDQDPDPAVRANAALGLATIATIGDADDGNELITKALARLLGHPDPIIRAHALSWAVKTNRPDSLERLLYELTTPDPGWEILFIVENLPDHVDAMPRRLHKRFTAALARLDENGWANRTEPGAYPDAEARAQTLADAAATLQLLEPTA